MQERYRLAADLLNQAQHITVFTGAGISVESGIPPFRGAEGLWSKYDPTILEITYFYRHPEHAWQVIKEIFYDYFGKAQPNAAHYILAKWEKNGRVKTVITQNIDYLHQEAGSQNVLEFHGTSRFLRCDQCGFRQDAKQVNLDQLPPLCPKCNQVLRPDFVFFGEPIPEPAQSLSFNEAELADLFLVIGTTGEIMPASLIPQRAKERGTKIIEINPQPSNFTTTITDVFLAEKATKAMKILDALVE